MSKSLADLRSDKESKSLPTRAVQICLDQAVIAEVQRLESEKRGLLVEDLRADTGDTEEQSTTPKRMSAAPQPPRVAEIDAELEACYDRMRQSEGELLLRAIPGGKWQRWKDAHPARKDNPSDEEMAFGMCNATDLLEALGDFVFKWNGEPFSPGDWDGWFMEKVAPADLRDLCTQVVSLHEARIAVPKLSSTSSGGETSATG